jgi:uncharacterized protein with PIN domain
MEQTATFRFYEELNDFLPEGLRKRAFPHNFKGSPSIKDTIESLGVPHTEVDLILINGISVTFSHRLHPGDAVSVYPVFETLDITGLTALRPKPLRTPAFVLDVHLGRLAGYLRILGFDTLYRNDYDDPEIVRISRAERRTILTRDLGILKTGAVTRGYWLRSQHPREQLREVVDRFELHRSAVPLSRCPVCNGILKRVSKESVQSVLPTKTRLLYSEFSQCPNCRKVYWKGSHYEELLNLVKTHTAR